MDLLFRFATGVYGQPIVVGAQWDLFWWFVAAGAVFIFAHAISVPIIEHRRAQVTRSRRR
jgi:hypothetical protein